MLEELLCRVVDAEAGTIEVGKRADIVAHLEEAGMIRGQIFAQPAGERGRPRTIYFDIA